MSFGITMNKKRKFVDDGVFHAELHSFFSRALPQAGYAGFQVYSQEYHKQIRIKVTKMGVLIGGDRDKQKGVKNVKVKQLQYAIQKRYRVDQKAIKLTILNIRDKGLCAAAQAQILKMKLLSNLPVRLSANAIIKNCMAHGAKGCEVIISGKLKQQRAKSMKFKKGQMISTGQPKNNFVDSAVRHVIFKQGIMGVKVKLMKPFSEQKQLGCKIQLPDVIQILQPKKQQEKDIRNTVKQNE